MFSFMREHIQLLRSWKDQLATRAINIWPRCGQENSE